MGEMVDLERERERLLSLLPRLSYALTELESFAETFPHDGHIRKLAAGAAALAREIDRCPR